MELNIDILESLLPNVLTIVTQLLATTILFILMKKLAWQPVQDILNKRSEYEQSRLTEAERLKQETTRMNEEARQELSSASEKAKKIISAGELEGERIKQQLIQDGQKESEETITQARKKMAFEREEMQKELQNQVVDIAITVAEKLMVEKMDETKDREAIQRFIKETKQ